ncbi:siderophore-interacting protein [Paractinoplanes toevensis]|uniref:siderophore-interacting protein n=1 Tax=Paractinoplanes toevensis TaxID=571911 RepID=UPI001FE8B893|nr:siderophore-interacting protein [Actinoplanes toevensis]
MREFVEACRASDLAAIRAALAAEVIAVCDGRGVVHGAGPVSGLVAELLCGQPGTSLTVESVNGSDGLALWRAGQALVVVAVDVAAARITALWIVLSPAKLRGWRRG